MMHPTTNDGLAFFQASMMTLSDDGLIRLTLETLRTIPFTHLLSGLDVHDGSPPICEAASLDPISGYTEWLSTTSPAITLGWDWWLDVRSPGYRLRCWSGCSGSNLRLRPTAAHHPTLPPGRSVPATTQWLCATCIPRCLGVVAICGHRFQQSDHVSVGKDVLRSSDCIDARVDFLCGGTRGQATDYGDEYRCGEVAAQGWLSSAPCGAAHDY